MDCICSGMQNTYQLGPYKDEVFVPSVVDKIVEETVNEFCSTVDLTSPENIKDACNAVSEKVRENVIEKSGMKRHKIIVNTVIVKDAGQSVRIASKFLADKLNDNLSSFTAKTDSGYIVSTTVFALYHE